MDDLGFGGAFNCLFAVIGVLLLLAVALAVTLAIVLL